ncbi:MAG TPA: DegV family protein, partial [Actinomycetota bacterium]|nr:DegV family protein [Actinomycetota bacterium]
MSRNGDVVSAGASFADRVPAASETADKPGTGRVRIVSDGGTDLPPDMAQGLGIQLVRGEVHMGTGVWHGSAEDFWEAVRAGQVPSTSAPAAHTLAGVYAGMDPVCAIHVSGELSRTVEHAKDAARGSGGRVHVVDSRSLSVGAGLVAVTAARAAQADLDLGHLKPAVRTMVDQVHV